MTRKEFRMNLANVSDRVFCGNGRRFTPIRVMRITAQDSSWAIRQAPSLVDPITDLDD